MIRATSNILYFCCIAMLCAAAIAFVAYMLAATILEVDGFRPVLRLSSTPSPFDKGVAEVLSYSIIVSILASIIAYVAVEIFLGRPLSWIAILAILVFYSFDPVVRVLSLRGLLEIASAHLGSGLGSMINDKLQRFVLPATALAFTYAPMYAIIRVWDVRSSNACVNRSIGFIYSHLQPSLRRAPVLIAILMLFCLSDPWVALLAQFNKSNYWGYLTLSRAVVYRAPGSAARFCAAGLAFVGLFLGIVYILRGVWNYFFRKLKPSPRTSISENKIFRLGLIIVLLLWGVWTPIWMFIQARANKHYGGDVDILGVISISIALAFFAGILSLSLGGGLTLAALRYQRIRVLILCCSLLLAFSPELAFALLSNAATSLGLITPGFIWSLFGIVAYTAPITFLFFDNFIRTRREMYIPLLSAAAGISVFRGGELLLRLLSRQFVLMTMLVMWLVLEDVIFLQYALGEMPGTIAVTVYNGSSHGMREGIALASLSGAVLKAGLITAAFYLLKRRDDEHES